MSEGKETKKAENIDTNQNTDNELVEEKEVKNTDQEVEKKEEESDKAASDQEDLNNELENLSNELQESKDKYLRLYSEFDNYKRRTSKERIDLIQSANAELMESLLPVIDDLQRAVSSFSEDVKIESIKEGIELINQKINKTLEQKGLKKMDTEAGTDFDPEIHEAITQIPAPDKKLKGKIVDTIEPGYFLGEKVVRFAKVVIGN